jgi:hypothetical protein
VVGHENYLLLDGFSCYHQIMITWKISTILLSSPIRELLWVVMPFGFKNALPTYQRVVNTTFKDYFGVFMKLFLDDFSVFNNLDTHILKLRLCFDKCRKFDISLNPKKCMFLVHLGKLPNPKKIAAFVHMLTPKTPKDIQVFNGMT